jgi:hypothetical protein
MRDMKPRAGWIRRGMTAAALLLALEAGVLAQANNDRGGFAVREVSVASGYAVVQLPPVTLGGYLPNDILDEDLITSAEAAIEWRHVTPLTRYRLDLAGAYTGRTRYSALSAPGADLAFGVTRSVGTRWRFGTGIASALISSDQPALQQTQARRLIDDAVSFDELAGAVVLARSPHPDPVQAALFIPIRQSLGGADVHGHRLLASSVRADATYAHTARLATSVRGSYTDVRRISSNPDPERLLSFLDSTAEGAGMEVRYASSERTHLTAAVDWSRTSGVYTDETLTPTLGYGWSERKWFGAVTVGAALRPFQPSAGAPPRIPSRKATLVTRAAIGYKYRTQTLLVKYSHAPHDEYGSGGRNTVTGFEGNVQSIAGAWFWSSPRGQWVARTDVSMIRRPGSFSYLYAWLATAGIGREIAPNVRLMGEFQFDRHGSRGFEGFHLMQESARLTLVWSPSRRRTAPAADQ